MHPSDLIKYIVWFATQNGIRLTTNRLVKFLYLADLYNARMQDGKTITGFPWRFIYYGPYCQEAMSAIAASVKKNLICKETYDSYFGEEKEYHIFWCRDDDAEKIYDKIHIGVAGSLQNAIKKYGDDTPHLLDHVYFDTEPMENVRKGDLLDFSKAKKFDPIEPIGLKKLPKEKIKAAREKISQLSAKISADRKRLAQSEMSSEKYKDEHYYQFLRHLDGDELDPGMSGSAKIRINE